MDAAIVHIVSARAEQAVADLEAQKAQNQKALELNERQVSRLKAERAQAEFRRGAIHTYKVVGSYCSGHFHPAPQPQRRPAQAEVLPSSAIAPELSESRDPSPNEDFSMHEQMERELDNGRLLKAMADSLNQPLAEKPTEFQGTAGDKQIEKQPVRAPQCSVDNAAPVAAAQPVDDETLKRIERRVIAPTATERVLDDRISQLNKDIPKLENASSALNARAASISGEQSAINEATARKVREVRHLPAVKDNSSIGGQLRRGGENYYREHPSVIDQDRDTQRFERMERLSRTG